MSARTGAKTGSLDKRLNALREALSVARDRLPAEDIQPASEIATRAGERLALGADLTVVALAGATGSGKSSLFNALSGSDLSKVGVRRPTTGIAHASVWGTAPADGLLDWLEVPRRHRLDDADRDGLVLLDLPDHDSTQTEHRAEVDRLIERVDLFVWVVDPQKYADAALHERYLRPLVNYEEVTLVVLNQIDRLAQTEVQRCLNDLKRLLTDDGLPNAPVLAVSARTGAGLHELRAAIDRRVAQRRAASERLAADLDGVADRWATYCTERRKDVSISRGDTSRLGRALSAAAGTEVVASAVERSHRRDAALVMGWPLTRWLRKMRPDPLRRLHLGAQAGEGRTSLPTASPMQNAQVENALRAMASTVGEGLPHPWPELIHARSGSERAALAADLDRAVAKTRLDMDRPTWWTIGRALQTLLAAAALVGFLWLAVLFVLGWLRIPLPPTPDVEEIPVPTLALIGGLLLGLLFAAIFRQLAGVGARRRRRRAEKRLRLAVEEVAETRVLSPIRAELDAYSEFCSSVAALR